MRNLKIIGLQVKIGKNNKWSDINYVTKQINGGDTGLPDRKNKFAFYRNKYKV
jgi:predicted chitinase